MSLGYTVDWQQNFQLVMQLMMAITRMMSGVQVNGKSFLDVALLWYHHHRCMYVINKVLCIKEQQESDI